MKSFALFVLFVVTQLVGASDYLLADEQIPVVGRTVDGKYPIYDLQGDLTDVNYFSGNTVYTSGDLLPKMQFVDPQDMNAHGYACGFVCKDREGRTVGLSPAYKQFLEK